MRLVYQAEHLIDAHLVRGRLQSEGIDAHVQGEWLTGALGELPLHGLLGVCVAERDVDAALHLLADWRERDHAALDDDVEEESESDDEPGSDASFLA
jgi:hypothetical protein